jgi:hypothetical protein
MSNTPNKFSRPRRFREPFSTLVNYALLLLGVDLLMIGIVLAPIAGLVYLLVKVSRALAHVVTTAGIVVSRASMYFLNREANPCEDCFSFLPSSSSGRSASSRSS